MRRRIIFDVSGETWGRLSSIPKGVRSKCLETLVLRLMKELEARGNIVVGELLQEREEFKNRLEDKRDARP